ncbi:hypothetical protein [Brachybacterium kimchii]|uniref:Uncharacterized protein n=1 Tax=Brachybacterium kimchii TaxID=2942909 RepID=A0ABY4N928_9MICO|nr:hypothetical protein [Brachybacterium kimchii]UQN31047.1 hypothetical protein M4486_07125 [Brachybacterium kimchii]
MPTLESQHGLAAATAHDGVTIASVYECAALQPRYRTGEDPAAVTDAHILHALGTLNG